MFGGSRQKLFATPRRDAKLRVSGPQIVFSLAVVGLIAYLGFLRRWWVTTAPELAATVAVESIYVLRTPQLNELSVQRFDQIKSDLRSSWVFLLVDDTRQPAGNNGTRIAGSTWRPGRSPLLLVNDAECREASPLHTEMAVTGQTALALTAAYFRELEYSHIWFVDWDVKCHGSYASCFAVPEAQQADLLAVHLTSYSEGLEWRWKELTGKIDGVSPQARWKASMQLVRMSRQLLQQIMEDLKVSSGFSGLYVPTFCAAIHCQAMDMPADKLGAFDEIDNDPNHSCTASEPVEGKWSHPCAT